LGTKFCVSLELLGPWWLAASGSYWSPALGEDAICLVCQLAALCALTPVCQAPTLALWKLSRWGSALFVRLVHDSLWIGKPTLPLGPIGSGGRFPSGVRLPQYLRRRASQPWQNR